MPLISIITVVRNAAPTVGRVIDSVVSQRSSDLEYVVVDGASTDGTVDILRSYGDRIDRWISEPDRGIYDAFNKAIALASGDYYVVAGADDVFFAGAVRELIDSGVLNDRPDFVVCDVMANNRRKSGYRPHLGWIRHNLMVSSHSLGMVIKRSVHEQIGLYPVRYRVLADGVIIKALAYGPYEARTSPVLMGEFGASGASSALYSDVMWEQFLVQLRTERWRSLQVLIFFIRLLKNLRRLIAYNRA